MNIKAKSLSSTLYFLMIFIMIYCSHDTLLFGTNANGLFIAVRKIIPFALIVGVFVLQRLRPIKWKTFFLLIFILALPFVSAIVNGESLSNYIYRCAVMCSAIFLILSQRENDYYEYYNKIIAFFSIWSIVTFLLSNFVPSIIRKFPVVINSLGNMYYNTIFSVVAPANESYGLIRNGGIFREPGVFMVFLVIALIFELCVLKKNRMKYIGLYSITLLTTLSTAGYIILALIYFYIMMMHKGLKYKRWIAAAIVVLTVTFMLQAGLFSHEGMFSKFQEGSNSYGSFYARFSSLIENAKIAIKNPLFGIGRYGLYDLTLATSGGYEAVDNTNTLLINFAAYGVLYGTIILLGVWKFLYHHQNRFLGSLCLMLILFLTLSNEDMGQNVVFYGIVFAGLLNSYLPKNIIEESRSVLD